MTHSFTATKQSFWIAHEEDVLEHGILGPNERVDTGLTYLETYEDPRSWNARLVALRKDYNTARAQWEETLRLRDPLARLADYRWKRETEGILVDDGVRLHTSREAQARINAALTALSQGMLQEPVLWKADGGWLRLSTSDIQTIAARVVAHVARCFRAEQHVAKQLAGDNTLDVEAAFNEAYRTLP